MKYGFETTDRETAERELMRAIYQRLSDGRAWYAGHVSIAQNGRAFRARVVMALADARECEVGETGLTNDDIERRVVATHEVDHLLGQRHDEDEEWKVEIVTLDDGREFERHASLLMRGSELKRIK